MVNNFIEYLFKSILEASTDGELPIYFSDSFREILTEMSEETGNEIASRLLYEEGKSSKRVFIDIDPDSNDKVSFLMANKAEEILNGTTRMKNLDFEMHDKIYKARQRGTMKINRFVNDLFNNEYQAKQLTPEEKLKLKEKGIKTAAQHLEDFVNQFKSMRDPGKFELVKGPEIPEWYHHEKYETDLGTMGGSCMAYDECQDYLEFYHLNQHKISMLIMKSKKEEDKIIGRALVWKLDEPSERIFMDRIYTNYDYDVESFKKYAKDNGWLYKFKQNMESSEKIVDTQTDETKFISLLVNDIQMTDDDEPEFPYLDTMKFYSPSLKKITNNESLLIGNVIYTLTGTDGTDFYRTEEHTIEELREMYYDDIINDLYYYAETFPDVFWNHIDDDRYVQDYIEGEIEYYETDLEYMDNLEDEVRKYIKDYVDDDKIPKNFDDLDFKELIELVDDLGIKYELCQDLVNDRYRNYTTQEVHEELYGDVNSLDKNMFNTYINYLDEEDFAEEISNNEDEDYLRDKYDNN